MISLPRLPSMREAQECVVSSNLANILTFSTLFLHLTYPEYFIKKVYYNATQSDYIPNQIAKKKNNVSAILI